MRNLPTRRRARGRMPRREGGAIAIVVGLMLAVLIGFAGLALDLGKLYVTRSELQNSADACALSAARDLTGATPLSVSEAAGIAAGHINTALFQSTPVTMTVDSSVTYSTTATGAYVDKGSVTGSLASIKYVQCTTSMSGIANWLIEVLNVLPGVSIGPGSVSARAVATTTSAQTTCAIPVFVCDPSKFSPAISYSIGQWLVGKGDSSTGTYAGGDFGWANLTGSGNSGTPSLSGELTGSGQCNLPVVGTTVGTAGNKASLDTAYNTRFGIYQGGTPPNDGTSTTDFTGFAYDAKTWSAQANAYSDFVTQRKNNAAYQGDTATGLKTKGTAAAKSVYQAGADRRLPIAPMVDCSNPGTGSGGAIFTLTGWACVLMLDPMQQGGNIDSVHLEYRGKAGDVGSPCATQGTPGAVGAVGPLVPVLVQ
ncbi:pilus assembly protein TadG [Pandoraea cepalis]|uniref:Pilus assembly protein TadG n=2 Tax=Pandoraea cepalis TaxID=2508294 RepID=A0A5E4WRM1_9BURK|nr:pilus assembly protein TadG [Pandoraea cepalis]